MKKNTNFANKYIIVSMEEKNTEKEGRKNPFFVPYTTPHETVPFDKIRLEDYEEAFLEGIRRDDEQIEKTINNPDEPTFDNTTWTTTRTDITTCCQGSPPYSSICSARRRMTRWMPWRRRYSQS